MSKTRRLIETKRPIPTLLVRQVKIQLPARKPAMRWLTITLSRDSMRSPGRSEDTA